MLPKMAIPLRKHREFLRASISFVLMISAMNCNLISSTKDVSTVSPQTSTTAPGTPGDVGYLTPISTSGITATLEPNTTVIPTPEGMWNRIVVSRREISEFGWLPNGHIYYGVKFQGSIIWNEYDPLYGTTIEIPNPFLKTDPTIYQAIIGNGEINASILAVSPSGQSVLYARYPKDYVIPTPAPYFTSYPDELWVAKENGKELIPLKKLFRCLAFDHSKSRWFDDETLIYGSCLQTPSPTFFIVDVSGRLVLHSNNYDSGAVYYIVLEAADGHLVSPLQVDMAHKSLNMVFSYNGLRVISLEEEPRDGPIELKNSSLLVAEGIASPLWSQDDEWIYYWRTGKFSGYDEYGFPNYPWWLERINAGTKQVDVILDKDDLITLVGTNTYIWKSRFYAWQPIWQLSPDGRQALLYIEPHILPPTLYLISW